MAVSFACCGIAAVLFVGRHQPHYVPDSPSHLDYPLTSLDAMCRSIRTPGYPRWLAVCRMTFGIDFVPLAQVVVHQIASAWLIIELRRLGMSLSGALVVGIAVAVGATAMDHVHTRKRSICPGRLSGGVRFSREARPCAAPRAEGVTTQQFTGDRSNAVRPKSFEVVGASDSKLREGADSLGSPLGATKHRGGNIARAPSLAFAYRLCSTSPKDLGEVTVKSLDQKRSLPNTSQYQLFDSPDGCGFSHWKYA